MQRRTQQLKYYAAITLLVLSAVAVLAAYFAAALAGSLSAKVSASSINAPLTSTLVINEVFRSSTTANEYIEIYNSRSTQVDLTSYTLYNSDNTSTGSDVTGTVRLSNLLPGRRIIPANSYTFITPADFITNTGRLIGNGLGAPSDYVALVENSTEAPVDLVNWGTVPDTGWNEYRRFSDFFFRSNIPQMTDQAANSLSRIPNGTDTDLGTDWRTAPRSPGSSNIAFTPTSTPTGNTATPTAPTSTPTGACQDSYESDNSQSAAKELLPGVDQNHTLCRTSGSKDYDWFRFGAVAGKQYVILTKDLTNPVDTVMILYDADGNQLNLNDDYQAGSLASRIAYTFTTTANYFVQVTDARSSGGLGYGYTISLLAQGVAQTATPDVTATPTQGACFDTLEPDGLPETAKLILIGSTQSHSICPTGDADWERFYARAGKVYTIRTSNLGVGTDTYIVLFTGDAKTILAQNDDGGDPANPVASRIDFYPQKDDWYLVQVKNAGDIGGPGLSYELSLAVVAGVPQPPGTATVLASPVITGTVGPSLTPLPTNTPIPTPTQGSTIPTPTPKPFVLTVPEPEAPTDQPIQVALPLTNSDPNAIANEIDASSDGNTTLPNVPHAGANPNIQKSVKSVNNAPQSAPKSAPAAPPRAVTLPTKLQSWAYTSLQFNVFYDGNRDELFDPVEGIRGLKIYFLNKNSGMAMSGQLVTSNSGIGKTILPVAPQQVYIPYLGISVPLKEFPERFEHSLWIPPATLPDKVP